MVLAASLRRGHPRRGLLWASALLFLGIAVLALGVIYATGLPVVLVTQPDGPIRVQLLKGVTKSAIQTGVYVLAFVGTGIYAVRASRRVGAA
jgi:hypothetical protein